MPGKRGSFIGTLARPHGVSGELKMNINPSFAESIEPGIPLFVELDGQRVPFFIEESEQVAGDTIIIRLTFIEALEEARKICGSKVYSSLQDDEDSPAGGNLHELEGFMLYDRGRGQLGEIIAVIDNSMNPLFEIKMGMESFFAPASDELLLKIDRRKKVVSMNLPDGIPGLTD